MKGSIVSLQNDKRVTSIADEILNRYGGKKAKLSTVINSYDDSDDIVAAILLLEAQNRIYIERHPSILNEKLRRTLLSSDIVYFGVFPSIRRKTLLYETGVEYGDFTINHILGCAHGCRYPCYASMISKRYGRVKDYEDWRKPRIVENALDILDSEIRKLKHKIRFVHLSFMTDPFMYDALNERNISWIEELTLDIIERLNSEEIRVTVLTKGKYPEALAEEKYGKENEYGITLTSLKQEFHSKYEPFSLNPKTRIDALRWLHEQGLKTWVSFEPYPTPNIIQQDLDEILQGLSFVDKMIFGKWNYSSKMREYDGYEEFYRSAGRKVVDFAEKNGILYHIKEKTPGSSKATEDIFYG